MPNLPIDNPLLPADPDRLPCTVAGRDQPTATVHRDGDELVVRVDFAGQPELWVEVRVDVRGMGT